MFSYPEFSRILTVVASIALTYGLYHQVWKIFTTKSAKDFTVPLIVALLFSETAWLNYGIAIQEWPIIAITSANLPAVILAAVGMYFYGSNQNGRQ
jgi:MtN3 and saliva related transmembrane protein